MKTERTLPLAVAVMAGGRSRRMSSDKAFLMWEGQRLIDRQIALLQTLHPAEAFVSGRPGVDYGVTGVTVVCDAFPDAGPLAGLEALLRATTAHHVLLLAVDMPLMTAKLLREMADRRRPGLGVVPSLADQWEPLAAIYPRELAAGVKDRLAGGLCSMRGLIDEAVARGEMIRYTPDPAHARQFFNWNEPDDSPV